MFWHSIWGECCRPKSGVVADIMHRTRALCNYALSAIWRKIHNLLLIILLQIILFTTKIDILGTKSNVFGVQQVRLVVLLIVLDVLRILPTNFLLNTRTYTHGFLFILTKWLTFGKIIIVPLEKRLRLLWLLCISFGNVQNAICILKPVENDGSLRTFVCLFLNACNELSVYVGFYWFYLLVFLCILMPPAICWLVLSFLSPKRRILTLPIQQIIVVCRVDNFFNFLTS